MEDTFEHFSDTNDLASALEQATVTNALAHVPHYELPEGFDGTCTDCGEAVHPARVRLGFATCIDCAELLERARRVARTR